MRGAGRDVNVAVCDSGGNQLFLVFFQGFRILQRRLCAATEEEHLYFLVELRGVGHGTAVDGFEVEFCGRWRRFTHKYGTTRPTGTETCRRAPAEQANVRELIEIGHG